MTLKESSIFINLKKLRHLLYSAQFNMTKADRIIYGTPLMEACGKALSSFILAFTIKEKRILYLEECMGYFSILRIDLEFCVRENIIKFKKRTKGKDINGIVINYINPED